MKRRHRLKQPVLKWSQRSRSLPATASSTLPAISTELPTVMVGAIALICVLPFILNLTGADFGSSAVALNLDVAASLSPQAFTDALHHALEGSYTHTLLEWSAFCTAIFTVVLAFAHFNIKHDVTTPVIGMALLCAGCMDAFHTLAANRLIEAVASNQNLIPFTWALCRLFNAVLMIAGVGLCLIGTRHKAWRGNTLFVTAVSSLFGLLAYGIIKLCATSESLPQTMFPSAFITRPWDIFPLILFLIAGLWIYPIFHRKNPSIFSHALIISAVPNVATQLHMAFGSTALFDNHFNIAHFLKIIAYVVPLLGLILDYVRTHQTLEKRNQEFLLEISERQKAQQELQETIQELQVTQMQLVQTEKMSSLGQLVAGVAHEINNPVSFIYGNINPAKGYVSDLFELISLYRKHLPEPPDEILEASEIMEVDFIQRDLPKLLTSIQLGADRIRQIVSSLRAFSRLDEAELKEANLHEGIDSALVLLGSRLNAANNRSEIEVVKSYGSLPLVECYPGQLNQVFMNILTNAIDAIDEKFSKRSPTGSGAVSDGGCIQITTTLLPNNRVSILIADNGKGIPQPILNKIFEPFFTTKSVGKGTGMGLPISYQVVTQNHQGNLTCESTPGVGSTFSIQIPVRLGEFSA